jgi:uncharacterized protein (UPF0305 family)
MHLFCTQDNRVRFLVEALKVPYSKFLWKAKPLHCRFESYPGGSPLGGEIGKHDGPLKRNLFFGA